MTKSPLNQKRFGRNVKGFILDSWIAIVPEILFRGLLAKFTQVERCKTYFKSTG